MCTMNLGTPPPFWGTSCAPKTRGSPLWMGSPSFIGKTPPNSRVPSAPQNSGTPSLFLGCPGPTRTPPPNLGVPPSFMGCLGTSGSPKLGGSHMHPKIRGPPPLHLQPPPHSFLGAPAPKRTPKVGGPPSFMGRPGSSAPPNSGIPFPTWGAPQKIGGGVLYPSTFGGPSSFLGGPGYLAPPKTQGPTRPPPPKSRGPLPLWGAPSNPGVPCAHPKIRPPTPFFP